MRPPSIFKQRKGSDDSWPAVIEESKKKKNLKNAPSDTIVSVYNLYGTAASIFSPNPPNNW